MRPILGKLSLFVWRLRRNAVLGERQFFVGMDAVDGTGLTGNYDFITKSFGPDEKDQVFIDQLGLEFVPTNMPIEMLVVGKIE